MNRLINAYFSRLFSWKIFRILLVLMFAGGVISAIILRNEGTIWNSPYMLAYMLFPHYVGIVLGLFNYPLFTNGTIRNQIAVGHSRRSVFFADWAASCLFTVLLYLTVSACILGVPLLMGKAADVAGSTESFGQIIIDDMMENAPQTSAASASVSAKAIAAGLALSCLHIILFSTITQLFCVILKGVKCFLAIYLGNQLLILAGVGISVLAARGDIPEKLICLFPTAACMRLGSFSVDPLTLPSVIAVIAETALVFILGMEFLRRTDIN